jgi:hypothetical protein
LHLHTQFAYSSPLAPEQRLISKMHAFLQLSPDVRPASAPKPAVSAAAPSTSTFLVLNPSVHAAWNPPHNKIEAEGTEPFPDFESELTEKTLDAQVEKSLANATAAAVVKGKKEKKSNKYVLSLRSKFKKVFGLRKRVWKAL